jgi:hypothetical protein
MRDNNIPRYIINFDELTDKLKSDLLQIVKDTIKNKYPQLNFDTKNAEDLLEEIKNLLLSDEYKKLKNKIEKFILLQYNGNQKIKGVLLDIPPLVQDYKKDFIFDKDVYLTGLHINQTGWKTEDRYSVEINKNRIIDNVTIKEIGEHKYFSTYYEVNVDIPISFILHNLSGNSRQVIVDLEYIEKI